jgi:peptide-methionine (S)-S-oxide reductase
MRVALISAWVLAACGSRPIGRMPRAPAAVRAAVVAVAPHADPWAAAIVIPVVGPFLQAKLGLAGDAINWAVQLLLLKEFVMYAKAALSAVQYAVVGPGRPCQYESLAGRPQSWAACAAANAIAGAVPTTSDDGLAVATFAGGCFWGIELLFQRVPGVVCTAVGYTQGSLARPSYGAVCSGRTGHCEAVQLVYDPAVVTYAQLCEALLAQLGGSVYKRNQVGNDRGPHYRHGIHPHTPAQRAEADAVLQRARGAAPFLRRVETELVDAAVFWPAEEYHQQYLEKGDGSNRPQSAEKGAVEKIRCYG